MTNSPWAGIIKVFLARASLVSDIPAGDGKIVNLFLQCNIKNSPSSVPEFIDPVFAKTSPKCLFLIIENVRFGLVFAKTGSINLGTGKALNERVRDRA